MVPRIARTRYSPALFDLAQDIVGGLPIRLLERWLESDQTDAAAMRLLTACQVTGYTVVSDSAGLTRLSAERGLMEILAIIDQPKAIVHRLGRAIGGESVGVWAADNTEMFYPAHVAAADLLSALLTVQDEVTRACAIKIGLGAHFGDFYSASGGLYGEAAEAIEALAENHVDGGEILATTAVTARLPPDHRFVLEAADGPRLPGLGELYRLLDGPRLPDRTAAAVPGARYPIPYSYAFYADLTRFEGHLDDRALAREMTEKYTRNKVVVLIERHAGHAGHDPATRAVALFHDLSLSAIMKDAGLRHLDPARGEEIKVTGPLAIYTFDDPGHALEFARTFRAALRAEDIACRIGIDLGPVLVFDLAGGGRDIAGMPVNVASKMAQDRGQWGELYLSERVHALVDAPGFRELHFLVSGVELRAFAG